MTFLPDFVLMRFRKPLSFLALVVEPRNVRFISAQLLAEPTFKFIGLMRVNNYAIISRKNFAPALQMGWVKNLRLSTIWWKPGELPKAASSLRSEGLPARPQISGGLRVRRLRLATCSNLRIYGPDFEPMLLMKG